MNFQDTDMTFHVWATDGLVYGPVDPRTLIQWAIEGRVQADTWVYSSFDAEWHAANSMPELQEPMASAQKRAVDDAPAASDDTVVPGELRQFAVFAGLTDDQLSQFLGYGKHCRLMAREWFIKKGDPGDALFFVLEGSIRVRLLIGREDRTLAVIPAGQFFGEMAMFNRAPRSADVVAETDARLLRVSAESFLAMTRESPALAAPILFALAGAMAGRVSDANQQLQREVTSSFLWS